MVGSCCCCFAVIGLWTGLLGRGGPLVRLRLPPGPIHAGFVSETWTGAPGGWSFQPSTLFRNLWAKSLPDGSWALRRLSPRASQQLPSFLESLCSRRALIWNQILVSWALPLPSLPGSWVLCGEVGAQGS